MAQIKKKFVGDNEISQTKIRLDNNTYLKARNAANSADINIIKVNGSDEPEVGLPLNVPTPTASTHAVTKTYVDTAVSGASAKGIKEPVKWVTQSDVNLATVGLTLDGSFLTAGDRVLVWKQTAASENGIYEASAGAWTRAGAADTSADFQDGFIVSSAVGSLLGERIFLVTAGASFVLDTSDVYIYKQSLFVQAFTYTLSISDISNQYFKLNYPFPDTNGVSLYVSGVKMYLGTDYGISADATTITNDSFRVTLLGDLATGGASELVANDVVYVEFRY